MGGVSLFGALVFTAQWGLMMTAMMLPSAVPMIMLYRSVKMKLPVRPRMIPSIAFVAVYLAIWTLMGLPIYFINVELMHVSPFLATSCLVLAGVYQFTSAKRACLRHCESPINFLMRRWHNSYSATFRIAVEHTLFCIGCCWALMLILVVTGAMSLPYVIAIAVVVFLEKLYPADGKTSKVLGVLMILFATYKFIV